MGELKAVHVLSLLAAENSLRTHVALDPDQHRCIHSNASGCDRGAASFQDNKIFVLSFSWFKLLDDLAAIDEKRPNHSAKAQAKQKPLNELLSLKNAQLEDIAVRRQLANELCLVIEESASALRSHVAYSGILVPIDERLRVS